MSTSNSAICPETVGCKSSHALRWILLIDVADCHE